MANRKKLSREKWDITYIEPGYQVTLTTREIREIWRAVHSGRPKAEIASQYGVTVPHVRKIYSGLTHFDETLDLRRARHWKGDAGSASVQRHYSSDEETYIKRHWGYKSPHEIADHLNRPLDSVRKKASSLGVTGRKMVYRQQKVGENIAG